jgi:two-component system, chemotaxis family, sensor kinase CheA
MQARAEDRTSEPTGAAGRVKFSILAKLLLLIVSLVLGVASLLGAYLVSRQVAEMRAELETKASAYGRLAAKEVESAIAFDDRETAREVFDSLAEDHDIESLTLFTSKGAILRARGVLSSAAPAALKHATQATPFSVGDRIGVAVPVVSLEGPRGTLVVELSTQRLAASRSAVLRRAAIAGLLAAAVGALGAFMIARSIARRLGAIVTVANAVAAGDLAQQPVADDRSRDEIGEMGRAFNAMLRQLQALIAQIRESAHEEQLRLETLVQARTVELAGRNEDMRRVLNHVGQGFLTLQRDGHVSRERSAILETWFGPLPASGSFVDYLAGVDRDFATWFNVAWDGVLDGSMPLAVTIDQLPRRLNHAGHHFELEYRPLLTEAGELDRALVVISDVTAAVEGARAETDEREATRLFTRLIADRAGFLEFVAEAQQLMADIRPGVASPLELARSLHTLKGNAGLYGLESLARLCHLLEDRLEEHDTLTQADVQPLVTRWSELSSKIRTLVGDQPNHLEIEESAYLELMAAIEGGVTRMQLRQMLVAWRLEPTQARLRRIAEQAEALATRLGKAPIEVQIESNQLRLSPQRWSPFWTAAVHVVRNALDHGLEGPDERKQRSKSTTGRLSLRSRLYEDSFVIEFSDDGRGIAWESVARKAQALGLPHGTRTELVDALFAEGLSTRDDVTEISGRGVGLGAARRACRDLGGRVEVESETNEGTTVRFVWPARMASAPSVRPPMVSGLPPLAAIKPAEDFVASRVT